MASVICSLCACVCHVINICWRFSCFAHCWRFAVHKDKQQFPQRFTLLCLVAAQTNFRKKKFLSWTSNEQKITYIKRLSSEKQGKNGQFFSQSLPLLLNFSVSMQTISGIIKSDCSSLSICRWIYQNHHKFMRKYTLVEWFFFLGLLTRSN